MKQYIMDYKGDDDEITDAFNALVVDINPGTPLDEDD
jgi:hypothetical protein